MTPRQTLNTMKGAARTSLTVSEVETVVISGSPSYEAVKKGTVKGGADLKFICNCLIRSG